MAAGISLPVCWPLVDAPARLRPTSPPWSATRPRSAHAPIVSAGGDGRRRLHGSGAETPTQVVLFATAAAAGSSDAAALVLLAFVVGLIASDLAVALLWLSGRVGTLRVPGGQLALGLLTSQQPCGRALVLIRTLRDAPCAVRRLDVRRRGPGDPGCRHLCASRRENVPKQAIHLDLQGTGSPMLGASRFALCSEIGAFEDCPRSLPRGPARDSCAARPSSTPQTSAAD